MDLKKLKLHQKQKRRSKQQIMDSLADIGLTITMPEYVYSDTIQPDGSRLLSYKQVPENLELKQVREQMRQNKIAILADQIYNGKKATIDTL